MSRTWRPCALRIGNVTHKSRRNLTSTPSRLFPEIEEATEDSPPLPASFLSTRSEIDVYLRAHNDEYLAKVKRHLETISRSADSMNTLLPELSRRASYIHPPPSNSSKNSIPPYIVSSWKKSAETVSSITQPLVDQVERVVKNVEDLQEEPYRADVTPSEREKVNKKVADWTKHEKEMELLNADFLRNGVEARFNGGVQRLGESVKAMLAAREEKAAEKAAAKVVAQARKEPPVSESTASRASTASSPSDGSATSYRPAAASPSVRSATSYRPLSGGPSPAPAAVVAPKQEGWGASATKVEERGSHHARTANPFAKTAYTPASNAKEGLEALRRKLEADSEPSQTSKEMSELKAEPKKAEPEADAEVAKSTAEPKVETKTRGLADLQRQMDASQRKKD